MLWSVHDSTCLPPRPRKKTYIAAAFYPGRYGSDGPRHVGARERRHAIKLLPGGRTRGALYSVSALVQTTHQGRQHKLGVSYSMIRSKGQCLKQEIRRAGISANRNLTNGQLVVHSMAKSCLVGTGPQQPTERLDDPYSSVAWTPRHHQPSQIHADTQIKLVTVWSESKTPPNPNEFCVASITQANHRLPWLGFNDPRDNTRRTLHQASDQSLLSFGIGAW